jgi:hypothetical protein
MVLIIFIDEAPGGVKAILGHIVDRSGAAAPLTLCCAVVEIFGLRFDL